MGVFIGMMSAGVLILFLEWRKRPYQAAWAIGYACVLLLAGVIGCIDHLWL